jgi:hypothetical protein
MSQPTVSAFVAAVVMVAIVLPALEIHVVIPAGFLFVEGFRGRSRRPDR